MRLSRSVLLLLGLASMRSLAALLPTCEQGPAMGTRTIDVWPEQLPAPDYLQTLRECLGKPLEQPESAWLDSQHAAFQGALAKQRVDVLVVPFQVQGYGLERTERALMSADLAYQLGRLVRVADPFLVARALGEGARRYERNHIIKLAQAVGARAVVIGYVGHDRAHHVTITIERLALDTTHAFPVVTNTVQRDWRDVPFTDTDPPFAVFHKMLPSVVESIGFANGDAGHALKPARFPRSAAFSFADLASRQDGMSWSVALDLLGAMAASTDELSRERLFERALVTSWHFDAAGDDTTFVRAYALTGLEHRPAALALLKDASRPEVAVLRALLNDNLSAATAALRSVKDPVPRLLLAVQVDDLRFANQDKDARRAAEADAFGGHAVDWRLLIEGRASDGDPWVADDPAGLKYLLDTVFPVAGLDVESVVGGGAVVGKPADRVAVSLATVRHIVRFVDSAPVLACCSAQTAKPSAWDLVGLIEGRNVSQIAKSLHWTINMQALPEQGGMDLERYLRVLGGHPVIAAASMDYALERVSGADSVTAKNWENQAETAARIVAYFAGGQSRLALRGLAALSHSGYEELSFTEAYGFDYPRRAYWPEEMFMTLGPDNPMSAQSLEALRQEAAAYTRWEVEPFAKLALAASSDAARDNLVSELQGRFVGTPGRTLLLSKLQPTPPAEIDPTERARSLLAENPDNWGARFQLGTLIVEHGGDYEDVQKLFLAHPPFHRGSPPNPVELSNTAYDAANFFFWNGHENLARPFFEISARLQTGSESGMASQIRLDILAGRYHRAADESLARARRYPSAYAYRDYLSFLHAFGLGEAAWSGFSQVASSFDNAQVWVSALVGQRRDGLSEPQIREWLKRSGIRDAKFRGTRFALRYAVLVNASDHEPPRDLGSLVEALEGEPEAWIDSDGNLTWPDAVDQNSFHFLLPSSFAGGRPREPKGTRVKSEFAYFGAAYAAIHYGDFDAAVKELDEMAAHYPIERQNYSYAVPYLAWAAAKTGDMIGFEKYVAAHGDLVGRFDFLLARAFFSGVMHKDPARARELLVSALPEHPTTENRPVLVEYQYAQACEWLFKETGDHAFVDVLLAWVKSQQVVHPTRAWAYAMEYAYAQSPARRRRALAMTLYLDPTSERITSATRKERREAQAWGEEHNPFLHETDESDVAGSARTASAGRAAPADAG